MIFYFSGTGNTKWVAKQLAKITNERLISIADCLTTQKEGNSQQLEFTLAEGERIGFCFPVHGWRPPFVVRQFARQLKLYNSKGHYCYAFATCGDDIGRTFELFNEDLGIIGLHTDSVFSIIMPESYLFPLIDMIDRPEVAEKKKENGQAALALIAPDIVEKKKGLRKVNESRWPRLNSFILGHFFLHQWVRDTPFKVDNKLCARCGLCARVCPVKNITAPKGQLPQWQHNGLCTTCFSCYHHCPKHAINFGLRTKGKRQYYFK